MTELATIARPYAQALFSACAPAERSAWAGTLLALAGVAGDAGLQQFAASPNATTEQVMGVAMVVLTSPPVPAIANLLQVVIDNNRLLALPEIAQQFQVLVDAQAGVCGAVVYSAYAMDAAQLSEVSTVLNKRFGRKLSLEVVVQPELIGGIRVVVGDEVLDTSVLARLEQMKATLTA
jgi:F-type H+-transporting ATPase subunit delta